jgi:hypothetical protein
MQRPGESLTVIRWSMDYETAWNYWMYNPDNMPEPDVWKMFQVRGGSTIWMKKPIPPKFQAMIREKHDLMHLYPTEDVCSQCGLAMDTTKLQYHLARIQRVLAERGRQESQDASM